MFSDKKTYEEVHSMFSDKKTYEKLTGDLTGKYKRKLVNTLSSLH